FEHYLTFHPEYFVSTEHFDLKNPISGFKDDIPAYYQYTQKIQKLSENYPTIFLRGIELGIVPGQEQLIQEYLEHYPYDLKLVSIHHNGHFDYMQKHVSKMDKFKVAKDYFEQMLTVLQNFHQGDILAHFDYGLRRFSFSVEELATHFESLIKQILKEVIRLEMALELNAKSFIRYENATLYRYVVPFYQSLGGKLFTLGSD